MDRDEIKNASSEIKHDIQTVSSSIIHGVEAVEKAFINAIRDEVEVLFHDSDVSHEKSLEKAKVTMDSYQRYNNLHKDVTHVKNENESEMSDLEYFTISHFPYGWGIH